MNNATKRYYAARQQEIENWKAKAKEAEELGIEVGNRCYEDLYYAVYNARVEASRPHTPAPSEQESVESVESVESAAQESVESVESAAQESVESVESAAQSTHTDPIESPSLDAAEQFAAQSTETVESTHTDPIESPSLKSTHTDAAESTHTEPIESTRKNTARAAPRRSTTITKGAPPGEDDFSLAQTLAKNQSTKDDGL